jgi:hypothetical protein
MFSLHGFFTNLPKGRSAPLISFSLTALFVISKNDLKDFLRFLFFLIIPPIPTV